VIVSKSNLLLIALHMKIVLYTQVLWLYSRLGHVDKRHPFSKKIFAPDLMDKDVTKIELVNLLVPVITFRKNLIGSKFSYV